MRGPKSPENKPLYNYTLMPTHMRYMFRVAELQNIELAEPFSFTKGCRTMKIAADGRKAPLEKLYTFGTMLFDLENDPNQLHPINDKNIEEYMISLMIKLMRKNDCPEEQFERLGLPVK